MSTSISVIHVHGVICAAYLSFGLAPLVFQTQLCLSKRFQKLRFFYLLVGLCYLALVMIENSHHQTVAHEAVSIASAWREQGAAAMV